MGRVSETWRCAIQKQRQTIFSRLQPISRQFEGVIGALQQQHVGVTMEVHENDSLGMPLQTLLLISAKMLRNSDPTS